MAKWTRRRFPEPKIGGSSPLWDGGISSIGRVRALQARGTGIETPMLHFAIFVVRVPANNFIVGNFPAASGLDGRAVQGARLKFESLLEAWVRIPLQALQLLFVSFYKKLQGVFRSGCSAGHWSSGMILL